ncbi:hypothetical protein AC579_2073 [Pseudocercospora musae]|uniref:Uncharacterized protein n=1 Tax=Pseudocercospora musae TaxID=113226 RepID=A0A139GUU5_9PEZI|nr:hypothetical protein AC579_2073 [Pseudocercospora musae]
MAPACCHMRVTILRMTVDTSTEGFEELSAAGEAESKGSSELSMYPNTTTRALSKTEEAYVSRIERRICRSHYHFQALDSVHSALLSTLRKMVSFTPNFSHSMPSFIQASRRCYALTFCDAQNRLFSQRSSPSDLLPLPLPSCVLF